METITQVYFDCEFLELRKDTDLISIGFTSPIENADGYNSLYIEITDYNKKNISPWVQENVINHLLYKNELPELSDGTYEERKYGKLLGYKCKKKEASDFIFDFLARVYEAAAGEANDCPQIQLVSDVCHFDFVLLMDLFGTAFNMPSFVSPVCRDINPDIAKFLSISEAKAFDVSREQLLESLESIVFLHNPDLPIRYAINEFPENLRNLKHNALYDAYVIRQIDSYMYYIKMFNLMAY